MGYKHSRSGAKGFNNACCCATETVFYRRVAPAFDAEQSGCGWGVLSVRASSRFPPGAGTVLMLAAIGQAGFVAGPIQKGRVEGQKDQRVDLC